MRISNWRVTATREMRLAIGSVTVAALCACGGGGGGTSTGTGGAGSPPVPAPVAENAAASLVPAAVLGQVLEQDALKFAPQVDGATWRFWGRQYSDAGAEMARYEANYKLSRGSDAWVLSGTNPGNDGPDTLRYTAAAGEVQQLQTVQFVEGRTPEAIRVTLLRSPIRTGDQVVAYTKRLDGVPDLDGDGKTDSVDIAIYTRVVGRETIESALGEALQAIRVETHLVQRPLYSKTGLPGPVIDIVGIDWFASGLGWVGRDQPSISSDGRVSIGKERLVGADVGDAGFGNAFGQIKIEMASTGTAGAGLPPSLTGARVFSNGQRALLMADPFEISYPPRPILTQLDSRGRVAWSRLGPESVRFASPLGAGWVLWGNLDEGALQVHRVDAQGATLTNAPQVLDLALPKAPLPSQARDFRLAGDSKALWAAWIQLDWFIDSDGKAATRDGIVVRGFDLNGSPISEPILLERQDSFGYFRGDLSVAVRDGQAVVGWISSNGGAPHLMLAQVAAGAPPKRVQPPLALTNTSTTVSLAASSDGVALAVDARYYDVDAALALTPYEGAQSDGRLPAWSESLISLDSFGLDGGGLFRARTLGEVNSGVPAGTSGWVMEWQAYRRGKPATSHRHAASVRVDFSSLMVPMQDGLLLFGTRMEASRPQWFVEAFRY